jgi:phosphatidylglycerol---prolipoprotein diacylglyceryl transferase
MGDETSGLYGQLLLGGAFVVAQITALCLAERAGLDSRTAFWLTVAGAAGALLGGSLWPAVATSGAGLVEVLLSGERGVIGAIAGATAAVVAWLALARRPILAHLDAMVPAAFLGYAVARMACLVDGHCFGIPTDLAFGITYAPGTNAYATQVAAGLIDTDAARSLPVHPTQLYHAAFGIAAFFVLLRWRGSYAGSRLALALALYGTGRFGIEFLRAETQPVLGPLDVNHIACLAMLMAALLLWRFAGRASPRRLFLKSTA